MTSYWISKYRLIIETYRNHQSPKQVGKYSLVCSLHCIYQLYTQLMFCQYLTGLIGVGRFKKTYELLNLRALHISPVNKMHIFQCMGKIFSVEFHGEPLKLHTKCLTHTLKDMIFIQHWNCKSLNKCFWNAPLIGQIYIQCHVCPTFSAAITITSLHKVHIYSKEVLTTIISNHCDDTHICRFECLPRV